MSCSVHLLLDEDATFFRFHSDDVANFNGFKIEYSTVERFTACGGTYTNHSGILDSPSYPHSYPPMADCVYLIALPVGSYVNISFLSMDVHCDEKPVHHSLSDYIEMRDGSSEDSPLMGKWCGNGSNVPMFMQTTQNYLRIR